MKQINNYIIEKFKLSSKNIKKYNLSQEDKDKIIEQLCRYFQGAGSYQSKEYSTRLQIVDKFFDKDIYEFFNQYDIWEDWTEYLDIKNEKDLKNYIEMNKEELYQEIKDFVLDDIIQ